ncbi:hypothetical protein CR513_23256, partial [Mucuna pruriens]
MKDENDALVRNDTWAPVQLPPDRHPIGCKWVFRVKENLDGSINKHKAQLVAKGFHQRSSFDYNEIFSPVVKPMTTHIIITLALTHHWPLKQLDINNAFLNGLLDEDVYLTQPPSFEDPNKTLVCKLNKAIYGLKQALRAWFDRLKSTLLQLGFKASKSDPSLFIQSIDSMVVYILVYVDDIIVTALGDLDYFFGIEVKPQPDGSLVLTQAKYP